MRNFLAFFRRFRVFLFFAFLQIIALSLHIRYLSFPKNQYLTTASAVTGKILEAENDVTKHFNLSKNNSELQQENIKLRTKIPESFYKVGRNLYKIEDTLYEQQFEYIPASVINSSVTRRNNYFTIDVGTKQGIKREMGVFSDKGVVGVIHNVSEHYSVVKTVLTKDINIDVTIEPIGLFGFLKWDGHNPKKGSVTGISNDLKIKRWSRVVTKGGSGIFPKGMPVGKVYETLPVEGEPLWDVVVKFSENFRTLQRVYVIKNLLIDEQKALERKIPQDEEEEDL
jgi:rod shape-determining protein MreC